MSSEQPSRRPCFQYSLRSLLMLVIFVACLCSFFKWFGVVLLSRIGLILAICLSAVYYIPALIIGAISTWALARRYRVTPRWSIGWLILGLSLFLNTAVCAYLGWAHNRLSQRGISFQPPPSWPHPDRLLEELFNYFEAQDAPLPPGVFEIHGKRPEVYAAFGVILSVLMGSLGAFVGPFFAPFPRRRAGH